MVYPRVCGGTSVIRDDASAWCGLSPRVRGNQGHYAKRGGKRRSIPACAGEPYPMVNTGHRRLVYPRVCGGTAG